jgi:hypothetical protein
MAPLFVYTRNVGKIVTDKEMLRYGSLDIAESSTFLYYSNHGLEVEAFATNKTIFLEVSTSNCYSRYISFTYYWLMNFYNIAKKWYDRVKKSCLHFNKQSPRMFFVEVIQTCYRQLYVCLGVTREKQIFR